YEPLNDPSRNFRLLRVLPKRCHGLVQVDLVTIPAVEGRRNECPPYRCLSYTWGSVGETHEICLSGNGHKVRQNLFEFLVHAAATFPLEWLWIDALCIDQETTAEKNIQVARMGTIYCTALEVIVWLG
ncbi:HET-domain-containing protein, partial [Setomelanomma holmii]